ncbi:MAG: lipopolysaccharide heptosyltransferase II [Chloroflexota bacterium]
MTDLRGVLITLLCRLLSLAFAPFLQHKVPERFPSSILILKPCCIGDVLMSTAAIAQLRKAFPRAKLAVAVGRWSREVLERNPNIDEFIDCGTIGSGLHTRPRDYLAFISQTKRAHFDMCIVLDRSPLISTIPFLAHIPRRIGLDSKGRGFTLTDKVPCPPERHEVELYLDTVRKMGITTIEPRLEFYPNEEDIAWARERMGERNRPTVAIHPGGGVNPGMELPSKRWLPEGFAAVTDRLLDRGARVVIVGATSEQSLANEVKSYLSSSLATDAYFVTDLTGSTSLSQLGAVLGECDLFIGNDAGPTHLAAAAGIPVVAIFGPSNPALYRPFTRRSVVLYKGTSCSPCLVQGKRPPPCPDIRCMRDITVEDVWRVVESLLKKGEE